MGSPLAMCVFYQSNCTNLTFPLQLFDLGVHIVVGAGNEGEDARTHTPAYCSKPITVGASDSRNRIWQFSNFGPAVDVFAPGHDIKSTTTYNAGPMIGTSMATANVSGLVAYLLSIPRAELITSLGAAGDVAVALVTELTALPADVPVSPPMMKRIITSMALQGILTGHVDCESHFLFPFLT